MSVMTAPSEAVGPESTRAASVASVRSLKRYFKRKSGEIVRAIDNVDIDVVPGEFLVLLGPSGCDKTTLLRSIAGLEQPDTGRIEIHGRPVFDSDRRLALPPERRDLGMIFQSYALWPHMTVFKNVAYPLQSRRNRMTRQEIAERVDRVLELLELSSLREQFPSQLSGGQQQRVALARALVGGNDLILFDEPLSNVDAKVRENLRLELKSMQADLGFSAIYVTHDQAEAMELADRIAVIKEGRIVQIAGPKEIYDEPTSQYVANFVGVSNQITGVLVEKSEDGTGVVETAFGRVVGLAIGVELGDEVVAVTRPERCRITSQQPTEEPNAWPVSVDTSMFLGAHVEVVVHLGGHAVRVWRADADTLPRGAEGWLSVPSDWVRILPREL